VFATHQETPHSAGIGRILTRHPEVLLCGDVHDYHLIFPAFVDRFRPMELGQSIPLGGTEFLLVEAVIRDLATTQWGFDTRSRTLFPGDGFAYSHYHAAGQCGRTAEETTGLALGEMTAVFAELALYWTQFTDMEPYIERLSRLVGPELGARLIAPTHGLPIADVAATVPKILDGLRLGSGRATD
jgi:flavorubredoxin